MMFQDRLIFQKRTRQRDPILVIASGEVELPGVIDQKLILDLKEIVSTLVLQRPHF